MKLYRFDEKAGHPVSNFGSRFTLSPLTDPEGKARAACFHLPPGGLVGRHPAATKQLFCVVDGEGWVSGGDGVRVPISAGQAAYWEADEEHEQGTDTGLVAITLEGDEFTPWAKPL